MTFRTALCDLLGIEYPILQSGEASRTRLASVAFGTYGDLKRRALAEAVALLS